MQAREHMMRVCVCAEGVGAGEGTHNEGLHLCG